MQLKTLNKSISTSIWLRFLILVMLVVTLSCTILSSDEPSDESVKETEIALGIKQTMDAQTQQQPTTQPPALPTEAIIEPTVPPPAATEAAAPTDEPAPEQPPSDDLIDRSASQSGDLYYVEDFEGMDGWYVFPTHGNFDGYGYELFDNRLRVDIESQDTWVYFMFEDAGEFQDVRVDITVENRASNTNFVGMICRQTAQGWYEANILNTGEYFIFYGGPEGSEDSIETMYKGQTRLIRTGQKINEYAMICQGEQLTLLINGEEAVSLPLRTGEFRFLESGQVGISVSTSYAIPVVVDFLQYILSVP